MAAITNGTGSTLKQNELAPRIMEAFFLLEKTETEEGLNRTTINTNFNNNTASVTFSFDVLPTIDVDGNVIHSVVPYLASTDFVPGDGSQIKGATLEQNILEMLSLVTILERSGQTIVPNTNNLTATYNYATGVFSGTMNFDLDVALKSTGIVELEAVEYFS